MVSLRWLSPLAWIRTYNLWVIRLLLTLWLIVCFDKGDATIMVQTHALWNKLSVLIKIMYKWPDSIYSWTNTRHTKYIRPQLATHTRVYVCLVYIILSKFIACTTAIDIKTNIRFNILTQICQYRFCTYMCSCVHMNLVTKLEKEFQLEVRLISKR